jgi:hypothetical protein
VACNNEANGGSLDRPYLKDIPVHLTIDTPKYKPPQPAGPEVLLPVDASAMRAVRWRAACLFPPLRTSERSDQPVEKADSCEAEAAHSTSPKQPRRATGVTLITPSSTFSASSNRSMSLRRSPRNHATSAFDAFSETAFV